MKNLLTLIALLFLVSSSLIAQYNSVGYDEKRGEWNVIVHEYQYWWDDNSPSLVHSFSFNIENQTGYNNITAIDIEFTLKQKGKVFYKQKMYVEISPGVDIGEVVQTKPWRMSSPIHKSKFDKNTTWSAKVVGTY
jgi:hypothetical protein